METRAATGSATANSPRAGQGGFTLLELLVVIAVLSVLSGVAVFAVGSMSKRAQEVACSTDERTLATAQEAHLAATGSVADEALLVISGYLDAPSEYHDITVTGDDYEIVAVGRCVGGGGGGPIEVAGPAAAEAAKKSETVESDAAKSDAAKAETTTPDAIGAGSAVKPEPARPEPVKPEPTTPDTSSPDKEAPEATRSRCEKGQVDINHADVEELLKIKHIGKTRAKLVVEARPFDSLEQLEKVKGLGPKLVAQIIEEDVACVEGDQDRTAAGIKRADESLRSQPTRRRNAR